VQVVFGGCGSAGDALNCTTYVPCRFLTRCVAVHPARRSSPTAGMTRRACRPGTLQAPQRPVPTICTAPPAPWPHLASRPQPGTAAVRAKNQSREARPFQRAQREAREGAGSARHAEHGARGRKARGTRARRARGTRGARHEARGTRGISSDADRLPRACRGVAPVIECEAPGDARRRRRFEPWLCLDGVVKYLHSRPVQIPGTGALLYSQGSRRRLRRASNPAQGCA